MLHQVKLQYIESLYVRSPAGDIIVFDASKFIIFKKKYSPICTFRSVLKRKSEETSARGISVKQDLEANSRSNKDIPVRSPHSVVHTENAGLGVEARCEESNTPT